MKQFKDSVNVWGEEAAPADKGGAPRLETLIFDCPTSSAPRWSFQHAKDAASIYIPPPSPASPDNTPRRPQTTMRCRGDAFCSLSPRHPRWQHINETTEKRKRRKEGRRNKRGGGGREEEIMNAKRVTGGEEEIRWEKKDGRRSEGEEEEEEGEEGGQMEWETNQQVERAQAFKRLLTRGSLASSNQTTQIRTDHSSWKLQAAPPRRPWYLLALALKRSQTRLGTTTKHLRASSKFTGLITTPWCLPFLSSATAITAKP